MQQLQIDQPIKLRMTMKDVMQENLQTKWKV
jgi:hypothetical protein